MAESQSYEQLQSTPSLDRLRGHRVLVVGAGSDDYGLEDPPMGIGRAIATVLAKEGAAVACADRRKEAALSTVEAIAEAGGLAVPIVGDVTSPADCQRIVDEAKEALGGLTGLVCNVAFPGPKSIANTTVEVWDEVQKTNLRSFFLITKAACEHLQPGASIVYIGSTAGERGNSGQPAYDSSKAGLIGLMKNIAIELGPRGIRVNCLSPGPIDTPVSRHVRGGRPRGDSMMVHIPLRRTGTAWEVAYPALFLLTPEASYITGQLISVDGGALLPQGTAQPG